MKSLQVLIPHQKCIFNCPFCISKTHEHNNTFINNYDLDYNKWKNNFIKIIKENNDLNYIVITGTNEPMQRVDCVEDIINVVRNINKNIQIEIQTHHYKESDIYNMLDVVAYSISNINIVKKIKPVGNKIRYVFILTDSFNNYNLYDILKLLPNEVKQITFKILHDSNGINKKIDNYINNHKVDDKTLNILKNNIENYKGNLSIRLDEFCMDAKDRYKIFREDGKLYNDWNEI